MNLVPLSDNVIVKPDPRKEKTDTGIYLPDTAKEVKDVRFGKVLAVGPGKPLDEPFAIVDGEAQFATRPVAVNDGDYVMYGAYAGHPFKQEGEEFVALEESDIIAVVK